MARNMKISSRRDTQTMDGQSPSKKLKQSRGSTTLPEFPLDIIVNILSRLPAKALIRFQIVCKLWFCLICHPFFVNLHLIRTLIQRRPGYLIKPNNRLQRSYNSQKIRPVYFLQNKEESAVRDKISEIFQPSDMVAADYSMVDSVNGLVCFTDYFLTICIYNPTTRECIYLPKCTDRIFEVAFAYDYLSRTYKVFRISPNYTPNGSHDVSRYEVFTLGSNSWRQKEFLPYYPCETTKHIQSCGAFHWLFGDKKNPTSLLSIHIGAEVHRICTLPCSSYGACSKFLIDCQGRLSVCMLSAHRLEIFQIIATTPTRYVWVKRHDVRLPTWISNAPSVPTKIHPTLVRRDSEIIISRGRNKLVFVDVSTFITRKVNTSGIGSWADIHIIEHIETLVPCTSRSKRWPETMKLLNSVYLDNKEVNVSTISKDGASTRVAGGT